MIKLVGEKLRQYDLNRTVEITPANGRTVEMVRFIRGRKPYMLAHREEGGKIIADIPNVLLKSFGAVKCTVDYVDEDGHIVTENQTFYVNKRDMPAGYSYIETDTLELGEGGSGSASKYTQPEWGVEKNVVLLSEVTVPIDTDSGGGAIVTPFNHIPEDGKTYSVSYNGVVYDCPSTFVTMGEDQLYILGNGDVMGLDVPASDAPFLLMVRTKEAAEQKGVHAVLGVFDGSISCTISISGEITHPIPGEYTGNANLPYFVHSMELHGDNYTHDENIVEILKMIYAGRQVYLNFGDLIFPVSGFVASYDNKASITFGGCYTIIPSGINSTKYFMLNADGTVYVSFN